jgi:DNA-binding beta-propeller fold protein YncE
MSIAGGNLYVSVANEKVLPISTSTYKVGKPINFAGSTGAIVPAPDSDYVYVSVGGVLLQALAVPTNRKFEGSVKPYATYLAITPNGKYIYPTGATPKGATLAVLSVSN